MTKTLFVCILLLAVSAFGQTSTFIDSADIYFHEIQIATSQNRDLWGMDLYASILLVRPDTREMFANYPDSAGVLKKAESIYSGILPDDVNIANTALDWNSRRWSMVILPLPENKKSRINLLAHELFHVAQPQLGFIAYNPANNHLDQKEGRIYLRLELESLKKAVLADSASKAKEHLTNALIFRKYRYSIYPGADSTENLLELNEGICEYTGVILSERTPQEMKIHFVKSIEQFLKRPTFVRSFAYETIPIYGYLLRSTQKDWNQEIDAKTNLTEYFLKAFHIQLPNDLKESATEAAAQYDGQKVFDEEIKRGEKIRQTKIGYHQKFVYQPHLSLPLENMNMSFDPTNIMPLDSVGTVYPNIRVTDNWGILTAENGALMDANWQTIIVSQPTEIKQGSASGDGWTLRLKDNYVVEKDDDGDNYILKKID